ncbi:(4Fe-4S)-binding protein [Methanocella sp. CWC-04]|uniref:(4Fe-4S)-binding protein n=1 Tax=Methanooceanicella nereidis TaxID=2052831 RepID=A0AAP2RB52_9EURY|nr:ATP-binding protein [Methanocella sp. CWC-04]MCD1294316.1 (4Fe-4S)-binding protein [Methanocella sp. CWC-04]
MHIAIASGKGGTGKSTVASNMAFALSESGYDVTLADCDVEGPNLHLFLQGGEYDTEDVTVKIPLIDRSRCTYCGKCAELCKFNAISCFPGHMLVFPELCHSCGGCVIACPENAITEQERKVGAIKTSYPPLSGKIKLITGILNEGEHSSVPVIDQVKERLKDADLALIDVAPGTSCNMVAGVRGCDHCILVTEPTPFGLHDLKLAVEVLREMGIPFSIIINKSLGEDRIIEDYCNGEGIEVLEKIPYDGTVAKLYSIGVLPASKMPGLSKMFLSMFERIKAGDKQ